jgi:predicted pyridoxine 5'-phosphate oxidase superfamily flavin-nucleotide-binding protein
VLQEGFSDFEEAPYENRKDIQGLAVLLKKSEFISVGTSDASGSPSVASKFLLKVDGNTVYLVDLIKGKTLRNVRYNPIISFPLWMRII